MRYSAINWQSIYINYDKHVHIKTCVLRVYYEHAKTAPNCRRIGEWEKNSNQTYLLNLSSNLAFLQYDFLFLLKQQPQGMETKIESNNSRKL